MGAIIIADLHVSKHRAKNQLIEERLLQLKADHPDDFLIVLGDVTDDGHCEQFAEAMSLLLPWRNRLLLCPGNHDRGPLGNFISEESVKRWASFCTWLEARDEVVLPPSETSPAWRIVCLDSTRIEGSDALLAQGELGDSELGRVQVAIERGRRQGQKVAVCLHHDPWNEDLGMGLVDAQGLLEAVQGADRLIYGHTHLKLDRGTLPGGTCKVRSVDWFKADNLDYVIL